MHNYLSYRFNKPLPFLLKISIQIWKQTEEKVDLGMVPRSEKVIWCNFKIESATVEFMVRWGEKGKKTEERGMNFDLYGKLMIKNAFKNWFHIEYKVFNSTHVTIVVHLSIVHTYGGNNECSCTHIYAPSDMVQEVNAALSEYKQSV